MSITKKVLDWTEEKYEDAVKNDKPVKACTKAFGIGMIEGFIDGAVIGTAVTCAIGLVKVTVKAITKKKK